VKRSLVTVNLTIVNLLQGGFGREGIIVYERGTPFMVLSVKFGLGIRGTQVKSSIQDIVDEVAPIKKAPYGVEGRFYSNVTSLD
jgi:hypothetical protein